MDELIDSLRKCFDGHGDFATNSYDENGAAQAFTTAVGSLGLEPEDFINLAIGQAKTMYTDKEFIDKAEHTIKDFVENQLKE